MIFGQDRDELRQMYADAWRKSQDGSMLTPLEAQIANVVEEHPEYHAVVEGDAAETDFPPHGDQSNPWLHMGLHLALREQVSTNRPDGIATIHSNVVRRGGNVHAAEHRMIDCLAETLWEAQSNNQPPDEQKYLERLKRLST